MTTVLGLWDVGCYMIGMEGGLGIGLAKFAGLIFEFYQQSKKEMTDVDINRKRILIGQTTITCESPWM